MLAELRIGDYRLAAMVPYVTFLSGSVLMRDTPRNGTSCLKGGGNYVLESHGDVYAPGGQGILDDPEHGPIMYYRYGEPPPSAHPPFPPTKSC